MLPERSQTRVSSWNIKTYCNKKLTIFKLDLTVTIKPLATCCYRVAKSVQHVARNKVARCSVEILRAFGWALTIFYHFLSTWRLPLQLVNCSQSERWWLSLNIFFIYFKPWGRRPFASNIFTSTHFNSQCRYTSDQEPLWLLIRCIQNLSAAGSTLVREMHLK